MAIDHWTLKNSVPTRDHKKFCPRCRAFTEMVFQAVREGVFSGLIQADCSKCNRPVSLVKPQRVSSE